MLSVLHDDVLLRDVPEHDGYKVLPPAVLYAKIGQGGMGAVYRGRHLTLDVDVAVKCLKPSLAADDPRFVQRFGREARLAAEISHENLVRVYHVDEHAGLHYLVMEFIEGETARDRVKRKGPLSEAEAATVLLGASRGLAKAHRHRNQIVHRDVKPDNILVSREGEVKIADLGIAKCLGEGTESEASLTSSHVSIGTPQYMPPEQWDDPSGVGPWSDVWAVGATLYFLLVGENAIKPGTMQQVCHDICNRPFPSVRERRHDLSPAIERILSRCVERDPSRRFADAGDLASALEECLSNHRTPLADDLSGTIRVQAAVSPPPSNALKRIRTLMESHSRDRDRSETLLEAAATPSGSGNDGSSTKSHSLRRASAYSAAILAFAGTGIWWFNGRHSDPTAGPPVDRTAPHGAPAFVLDVPFADDDRAFTSLTTFELNGRVVEDVSRDFRIAVVRDGHRSQYPLEADGAFAIPVLLTPDNADALELDYHGSTRRIEIVQDSTDPRVDVISPRENERVTRERAIDVVVNASDKNLSQVLNGARPLEPRADGTWIAAGVPLLQEGSNSITITARDKAGREGTATFVAVRDTVPPNCISCVPPAGSELEAGSNPAIRLEFSEPIRRATLDGSDMKIEHTVASTLIHVPLRVGAFTLKWVSEDLAGNVAQGELGYGLLAKAVARVPDGWDVVDGVAASGGWAKKARERRSEIVFILVPPGSFRMGSPSNESGRKSNETDHEIALSQPFYLGETEVTQAQFERIIGANPSKFRGANLPVEQVTWNEATAFCHAIGCELPTEAQWEYACRAGTSTPFSFGATIGTDDANYDGERVYGPGTKGVFRRSTVTVKSLPASDWGFFEMHGNVWEWCLDGFRADYEALPVRDPLEASGDFRILRGGSWEDGPSDCRSARRIPLSPSSKNEITGFRASRRLP